MAHSVSVYTSTSRVYTTLSVYTQIAELAHSVYTQKVLFIHGVRLTLHHVYTRNRICVYTTCGTRQRVYTRNAVLCTRAAIPPTRSPAREPPLHSRETLDFPILSVREWVVTQISPSSISSFGLIEAGRARIQCGTGRGREVHTVYQCAPVHSLNLRGAMSSAGSYIDP